MKNLFKKNNYYFGFDKFSLNRLLNIDYLKSFIGVQKILPFTELSVRGQGLEKDTTACVHGSKLWFWGKAGAVQSPKDGLHNALLLPESCYLKRTLTLPKSALEKITTMALLEAQAASPFHWDETIWIYSFTSAVDSKDQLCLSIFITSKEIVDREINLHYPELKTTDVVEVWINDGSVFLHFPQFGGKKRFASEGRKVALSCLGMLLCVILVCLLVLTPTLQLRLRVLDGVKNFDSLSQQASPVLAKRQALVTAVEDYNNLQKNWRKQINHVKVLAVLTRLYPDDTAIQRMEINDNKLLVQGITANASNVLQKMSVEEGFTNVKLPTAVSKIGNTTNETFVLEAIIDLNVFGIVENKITEPQAGVEK